MSYNLWQHTGKAYHAPTLNNLGSIEKMTQVLGEAGGGDHFIFVHTNNTPDPNDDIIVETQPGFGYSQDDCVVQGQHADTAACHQ